MCEGPLGAMFQSFRCLFSIELIPQSNDAADNLRCRRAPIGSRRIIELKSHVSLSISGDRGNRQWRGGGAREPPSDIKRPPELSNASCDARFHCSEAKQAV